MLYKETSIDSLLNIIKKLRGKNGCPWDKEQTPGSISIYLTEEAFELQEAIDSGSIDNICEEAGDILFQLLTIIRMFEEQGLFSLENVCNRVLKKMVHRHPHVFGNEKIESTEEIKALWQRIKKEEKSEASSILDSIPNSLPALIKAYRVSARAAIAGFDWDNVSQVLQKAEEEWSEFKAELEKNGDKENAEIEIGDMLFTLANVARFAGIHPETGLNKSVIKFKKRFQLMEIEASKKGKSIETTEPQDLEKMWERAKLKTGPLN